MSAHERDKLLMAYLDGQMSAIEASAFDESLSDAERERLAAELQLEAGIAEIVKSDACCPMATWKRTQQLVRRHQRGTGRGWPIRIGGLLAAAAVLLVVVGRLLTQPGPDSLLNLPEASLGDLERTSQVNRNVEAIQDFLHDHGIDATLAGLQLGGPESRHHAELLGARERNYRGEAVVELLYSCCGQSAKVVMARPGTPAAEALSAGANSLRGTAATEKYVAGVVSGHNAQDLLEYIRPTSA